MVNRNKPSGFPDAWSEGTTPAEGPPIVPVGATLELDPFDRHPVHYHVDGNIIFLAGTTMFRHYKGLMAQHSLYMRNIFPDASVRPAQTQQNDAGFLRTASSDEVYDGAQVVKLSVSADEFASLLDYIFPKVTTCDGKAPPSLETLLSVLRVSSEHNFNSAQSAAVSHLHGVLPTTFTQYSSADKRFSDLQSLRLAQIIRSARRYDLPQLLPISFYLLAVKWGDMGSIQDMASTCQILGPTDVARLARGRRELSKRVLSMANDMHQYYSTKVSACETDINQGKCRRAKRDALFDDFGAAIDEFVQDPLRVLLEPQFLFLLCEWCRNNYSDEEKKRAESLYGDLGSIFQL